MAAKRNVTTDEFNELKKKEKKKKKKKYPRFYYTEEEDDYARYKVERVRAQELCRGEIEPIVSTFIFLCSNCNLTSPTNINPIQA